MGHEVVLLGEEKYIQDFCFVFPEYALNNRIFITASDMKCIAPEHPVAAEYIVCAPTDKVDISKLRKTLARNRKGLSIRRWWKSRHAKFEFAESLFGRLDQENDLSYWAKERPIAVLCEHPGRVEDLIAKGIRIEKYIALNEAVRSVFAERGITAITPDEFEAENNKYYVIVAVNEWERGVSLLDGIGLKVRDDYMDAGMFTSVKPSEMLKQIIGAQGYDLPNCRAPFERLIIDADMRPFPCCPSGIKPAFVNPMKLYFFSMKEMWQSGWFKVFRLSINNKTYAFCDWHFCQLLHEGAERTDIRVNNEMKGTESGPKDLQAEVDYTCNLHCPSCRSGICVASEFRKYVLNVVVSDFIENGYLDNLEWLRLAGYGDVFASEYYQKMLYSDKQRQNLFLITNGNLFTEQKFDPLPQIYQYMTVYISVDAACEETYNKLRPGGNWDKLMSNLRMLSQKKSEGKIDVLTLNYVIQQENYKEVPDFIRLATELKVDHIYFNCIRQWNHMTSEEYAKKSILNEDYSIKDEVKPFIFSEEYNEAPEGFIILDFLH